MSEICHIAVVIPTYNNASDFRNAVKSVIASAKHASILLQLSLKVDIVLVDDGSQDKSADLAQDMAKNLVLPEGITIISIRHSTNKGAGPARNSGVKATEADYIFFLDADDVFLPRHIGLCLQKLISSPHLGYVWGRRSWDIPVHPTWSERLDQSSVMNLCVRRAWHDICEGFPEHPDFRDHGHEDNYYRVILRRLIRGEAIDEETTHVHLREGNALDDQSTKFAEPYEEWDVADDTRQPTEAMLADLETRLEKVKAIREEFLKSP